MSTAFSISLLKRLTKCNSNSQSSASNTSIHALHRQLRVAIQLALCLNTAAAPTLPSSARDPSVPHIHTPAPTLTSFFSRLPLRDFLGYPLVFYYHSHGWLLLQSEPACTFHSSAASMLFVHHSVDGCAGGGIFVKLVQLGTFASVC